MSAVAALPDSLPAAGQARAAHWTSCLTWLHRLALCAAIILYVSVIVRTAWQGDDAYIAMRTVDNFVNGLGLTWNVDERVQTFTCPLWVLLLSIPYYFTREPVYSSFGLSLVCSLGTVAVLCWHSLRKGGPVVLAVLALVSSKAFVDYSASGLENPLTHLLLASFLAVYLRGSELGVRRVGVLALLAALAAVNRLDTILFFAPAIGLTWWQRRSWAASGMVAAGFLPLAAWLGFALFYYGFAFPNTAYAKLHTGISQSALAWQGWYYYCNSLTWDPVTLPCIALGLVAAMSSLVRPISHGAVAKRLMGLQFHNRPHWSQYIAASLGIVLYLAYIVRIGGDFMSGRFFAAPLLASGILFSAPPHRWPAWLTAPLSALIVIAGACPVTSNLRSGPDYGPDDLSKVFDQHHISDERAFFYRGSGLLRARDNDASVFADWRKSGLEDRRHAAQNPIVLAGCVGIRCFYGGPAIHYIDPLGLGDPLLSRLPARDPLNCRIGHFERALPIGYLATLVSGQNVLVDPRLNAYYERLRLITRGDLFDRRRLREVVRMAKGRYDCLLADQPPIPPPLPLPNAQAP
jgi:arabinofuranosyltransferase